MIIWRCEWEKNPGFNLVDRIGVWIACPKRVHYLPKNDIPDHHLKWKYPILSL